MESIKYYQSRKVISVSSTTKQRIKNPPERRKRFKSRKEAYQKAKRAGKGKEPIKHTNDQGQDPHYHPDVKNSQRTTPKSPSFHDHYYYR